MNVVAESYGQGVILNCKGELTADCLDVFKQAVEHQLEEEQIHTVVLNFEEVPFVDSAALEYLLDVQERQSEQLRKVALVGSDENVRKILQITRLDSVFERFSNVSEAMKAISA